LSGRDGVYRAAFDEQSGEWEVTPYWTFPGSSGEADERHVNGIDFVGDELCVSGFGRKEGEMWPTARGGFVYNVDRDEYVTKGIYHPHSLLDDSGTLWICESPNRRVWSDSGEEYDFPPGYIRGLIVEDEYLYVGSSKRRVVSKSTGRVSRQAPEYEGTCCVYRVDRATGDTKVLVDFSETRNEIFELLPV
jgi:sugar lactone lactonase YvrE